MDKMKDIMQGLRDKPLAALGTLKVVAREDYKTLVHKDELTGEEWHIDLPNANILIYYLEGGHQVIVRPSGTEPKIKVYYSIKGKDLAEATEIKADIDTVIKAVLA